MASEFIRKHRMKILLITVIVLILPFCLVYFAISLPPARRVILDYTESAINQYIVGEVRINDFHTDLFTKVTLYGVKAWSDNSDEDTLNIRQIEINLRSPALLKKRVEINRVTIRHANASAGRDHDGKFHFLLMPKSSKSEEKHKKEPAPPKEAQRWKFKVNSIAVRNSQLSYSDSKLHARLDLRTDAKVSFKHDTIGIKIMAGSGVLSTPVIEWQIDTAFADGYIDGNKRLRIEHLLIHADDAHIDVHGIIPFLEDEFWNLSAYISASLREAAAPIINGATFHHESRVDMFLQINGRQLEPFGELKSDIGETVVRNIRVDTLHLNTKFNMMSDSIETRFFLLTDAGNAQGDISVILGGGLTDTLFVKSYQLDAVLRELNIPKILHPRKLNHSDQTLKTNAVITAFGTSENGISPFPKDAKINVMFDLPKEYSIEPVQFDIVLDNNKWSAIGTLGRLNKLEGRGTLSNDSISGQVNALLLNPQLISTLFIDQPITGKLSIHSNLNGLLSSPDIDAVITSTRLNWNGISADTLYTKATLRSGQLIIDESLIELNADLNTQTAFVSAAKGKIKAVVKASGPVEEITAYADFNAKHIFYNNFYLDLIEGSIVYHADTINVDAILSQQIKDGLFILVNSKISFANDTLSGNGGLMLSTPSYTDTNALFFAARLPLQSANKTKFAENSHILLNSASFPLGLLASSFLPEISTNAAAFIDAQINLEQQIWTLTGGALIQIDTMCYGKKRLLLTNLPINAVLSGSIENPYISIITKNGHIEYHDIEAQIVNIKAVFSRHDININNLHLAFNHDGHAIVSAYYPLNIKTSSLLGMKANYDLKRFPLPVLSSILGEAEIASGVLNGKGDFAFGDTLASFGLLRVDSLSIKYHKVNRPIGPVYATFTHNNEWVSLPYLRGKLGGPFIIMGRARCSDKAVETIDLFAEGKNIRFRYDNNIDLGLSTVKITASGRDNKIDSIGGYINLGETRYYQNLAILDLIEQFLTIKTEERPHITPFLAPARINLDLRLKSNAIVITSAGRMHLTGRLIFEGTAADPTVNGEVRLVQTHIRYLDNRFNIGDEYIRRMRPVAIDRLMSPVNDQSVRTFMFNDQKDFIIGVAVSGSLYEPQTMLTSHPPLKSEQILNLLTSGTLTRAPTSLYSPSEVASVYAGGWVSWELMNLTDITFIDINGNLNEFTEERGPRLTLFQRFTEKVYGSYQLQLGKPEDQAVSVIYRFMPQFFVSGTAGTRNSGAALWYFFRR
ncbi:MAG: translocation/assembly module TamB domain-containing protein [Chitinispirillia bacterium]|nr:translocation/assembly module TamB domain-containing protein [Chitinispirillia bacterium]